MDSKQNIETTTPSKGIFNSVHGKLAHNTFNTESPFRRLPNFSTPPSRFAKIKNPFEHHVAERLHTPFFSPSVFKVSSPKIEEKFKWTIDDISSLKPADIDETTIDLHETSDHDSMMESHAQAKIDLFFSDSVAPSPFNQEIKTCPLISEVETKEIKKTFSNGIVQTVLSLPPKLPDHIEAVLRPYFTYTESQQQSDSANISFYRKLFDFENDNESIHCSVDSSPPQSLILSPIAPLPENLKRRDLDTNSSPFNLDECNLSPIDANGSYDQVEEKSNTKLNFSSYMSIDNSMNVVPDGYELRSDSVNFDSTQSSVKEMLSDSTINWDMEYKHVLLCTPNKNDKEMDVSNSNTPKSKIFTSQRKKLSDSFLQEYDEFDHKENMETCVDRNNINEHDHLYAKQDITDAGYQTGIHTLSEDASWYSSNMYASTPTKKLNGIN